MKIGNLFHIDPKYLRSLLAGDSPGSGIRTLFSFYFLQGDSNPDFVCLECVLSTMGLAHDDLEVLVGDAMRLDLALHTVDCSMDRGGGRKAGGGDGASCRE